MATSERASIGDRTHSARRTLRAMRRITVPLALAGLLAAAPAAAADVLISAIPKRIVCGAPIKPGIRAQPGTTGSRWVRMKAVDRATGKVWWRKTAKARTRSWRDWCLPSGMDGQCQPTTFVYVVNGQNVKYRIRFKGEGVYAAPQAPGGTVDTRATTIRRGGPPRLSDHLVASRLRIRDGRPDVYAREDG